MNGPPQFAELTRGRPRAINRTRIDTLTKTITLLTRADSLIPMTSKAVTSSHDHHGRQIDDCRELGIAAEIDVGRFEAFLHRCEHRPSMPKVQLTRDRIGHLDHHRARRGQELRRQVDAPIVQKARDVSGPVDRDRGCADHVFEDQVPADQPGDELAHRGIGVGVRRAGDRNGRGHLGVAKTRECADDSAQNERDRYRRSGKLGGCFAGQPEEAGADHRADAEQNEVRARQRALQSLARSIRRFGFQIGDRFPYPQICHGLVSLDSVNCLAMCRAWLDQAVGALARVRWPMIGERL